MKKLFCIFTVILTCLFIASPLFASGRWVSKPPSGTQLDPAQPSTKGLVFAGFFSEGAGSQANDISGNNNHGTINGAVWGDGGLRFDGTDDLVVVANESNFDFDITEPFSGLAYIKVASVTGSITIFSKFNNTPPPIGWFFYVLETGGEGRLLFQVQSSGYLYRHGSTNLDDGAWHHVAFTYDGSNSLAGIKLYVDGVEESYTDGSSPTVGSILTNEPVRIGARDVDEADPHWFDGNIDMVIIHDYLLSPAEVKGRSSDLYAVFQRQQPWRWLEAAIRRLFIVD
jgi:hypothetical protein